MGEVSKKRGEFGEDVVTKLLELIGWDSIITGRDIECSNPKEHKISNSNRKNHGVDFVFNYQCPLISETQMHILISSKYNDSYPSNPTSKFKSHLEDIAFASKCYEKSSLKYRLKNTRSNFRNKVNGVIFWLDNKSDYNDVIEKLGDFNIDDNLEFESIYLVDNNRAGFLFNSINFVKDKFKNSNIEFFHPRTGYNITAGHRKSSSPILPVQYINTSIIPIKVENDDDEYLVITTIDLFEEDYLRKLISLSQALTDSWAKKIYILFPDYNGDRHGDKVEEVKLEFLDFKFIKKITISSFNLNFRNIEFK
ncbi:GapS4a family protein [Tenacibaculum finnmarkense]|uniref:GAPS4 PD-(D/E)XK nuclease domain-containing protein n=1 Tax=Tenacibaculum finnmarkense genomovar finnmarkense TaxID=1458503 RepID=A0AAP1RFZ4_9FLAO|nr:hypothetical protein [Tenacibaculum finnmarkense]MBE7653324.1 hypothetical protein [Tenacibaculum finnmarkense genomovar finnmarkense]MBE7695624.1 hypothetical protein [Tenacibaculum finnmarkense genomovar finnmarkense]MCD8427714.1 hypothetical protein [Tenacibaculum finnmarkense genomovar finnmarkense]MCG8731485.1 hypothetical protein [Tenacibaculum finnmarkense]MCG8751682.1 hypothetical protein [Tenacibaculum finnmarkense]